MQWSSTGRTFGSSSSGQLDGPFVQNAVVKISCSTVGPRSFNLLEDGIRWVGSLVGREGQVEKGPFVMVLECVSYGHAVILDMNNVCMYEKYMDIDII